MNHLNQNQNPGSDENQDQQPQYSLCKIILIWFLATAPMTLLAFVVTPLVIRSFDIPPDYPAFLVFWPFMIIGLIWQFVLSLIIVYREEGNIRWKTLQKRMWYRKPQNPRSGKKQAKMFLWVIPFIALSYASQYIPLPDIVGNWFPFTRGLPQYHLQEVMTPAFEGAWFLLLLTLITIPFNYFLGEEFLFRGILLPRMKGVFGKWDWFFNGVFFAFYHLHKPFGIIRQALFSGFILSLPARIFKSNWMAVIIHGTEGLVAIYIIMKIILG